MEVNPIVLTTGIMLLCKMMHILGTIGLVMRRGSGEELGSWWMGIRLQRILTFSAFYYD